MRRALPSLLLIACAALWPQVAAGSAHARVSRHFLGMNVDGPALAPGVEVRRQLREIRQAGAGSVRWSLDWAAVQPYRDWSEVPAERRGQFSNVRGAPMDFRATDRIVASAAAARLRALPVIMTAAPWVAENPFVPFSPPTDIAAFGG
ncbi:MAG TPA: hypothetical protein VFQ66_04530, partial [Candidatus Limnocylindria bacterium]|nr:hypothetical protein [Candidatus Limnocylindria bacterium]